MKKLMFALCALASVAAIAETYEIASSEIASPEEAAQESTLHWTPLELNVGSPVVCFPWWDRDVYGLKLNFAYGSSVKTYGVDLGAVSRNVGDVMGFQANAFNWDSKRMLGVQAGGLANVVMSGFAGVQLSGAFTYDLDASAGVLISPVTFTTGFKGWEIGAFNWEFATFDGWQLGAVNTTQAEFRGLQLGAVNWCARSMTGLQLGAINCCEGESTGVQIGVFNGADSLTGVQLGLFNINIAGKLPLMVILNANF